jgi:hypothetical protein
LLVRIELFPGVGLTVEADSMPTDDTVRALQRAATPLLDELRRAGLLTT